MPERKLLITTFEHPQGPGVPLGLGARAYWYSWFKRTNLRSWGLFNEKFGAPTVVARHPQGLSEDERRTMLEALDCIHHDAGVALPEHIGLTLLEASRPGSADSYRQLAEWCNDEISRIVLGATLTTGEGHRSGSLALGRVHDSIRHEYVMADAAVLEEALDRLLRWVVDVNLGVDTPAPTITFDTMSHDRLLADAQLDRELVALGLPLSVDDFYDRYNRPRPTPDAAVINYDDRNVFQYHLRYGVLTINEVRARMGLAPVPWGDTRTGTETWAPSSPDPGGEQVRAESDHDGAKGREDPQRDDPTETEPEPGDAA
jgi:phage gp29-like protein